MPRTVLFADPDSQILRALETMFADDVDVTVLTASTVTAALETIRQQSVDLVVAERMRDPERGTELLLSVRHLRPDTPIMLLTDLEPNQHSSGRERLGQDLVIL